MYNAFQSIPFKGKVVLFYLGISVRIGLALIGAIYHLPFYC